jgi:hypothetical protein
LLGVPAIARAADDAPQFVPRPARTFLVRPAPGPHEPLAGPVTPYALGLRVVYLNFDGVTLTASNDIDDARTNISGILSAAVSPGSSRAISPFDPSDLSSTGGLSRAAIITRVVDRMYQIHAPYDIEFVTTRPSSGAYTMVVFGGTCSSVAGQENCAGIALLDCGDFMPANIVFAFPDGLRVDDLVTTAAQEMAHAFGLNHTNDDSDIMFPVIQPTPPVAYGAGAIPGSDPLNCGGRTTQDSHQLMLDTIGDRGDDVLAPVVSIVSPFQGAAIAPGGIVNADATDPSGIDMVELLIDGARVQGVDVAPYRFTIPGDHPGGTVTLGVRATDNMGNQGVAEQPIYITTGDEDKCTRDDDCNGTLECTNGLCIPDNGIEGELGDDCSSTTCTVGECATLDGESLCSVPCDDANPCPTGFECRGGTACWPADSDGGWLCSTAGSARGAPGAWILALAALVLCLRRRRRGQK